MLYILLIAVLTATSPDPIVVKIEGFRSKEACEARATDVQASHPLFVNGVSRCIPSQERTS